MHKAYQGQGSGSLVYRAIKCTRNPVTATNEARPYAKEQARDCRARCATSAPVNAAAGPTKEQLAAKITLLFSKNNLKSEDDFFAVLDGMVKQKLAPPELITIWRDFYQSYKAAVVGSGKFGEERVLEQQAKIAERVFQEFIDPYTFPSEHQRILEPYNYYDFGQTYGETLIDMDNSVLGYPERWAEIAEQLAQGHNVVLLANHQTEADPAVFAHMLEKAHPELATDVIYVAGDRVVTDPLCKPFSMGRNLYCVYSKRHMDDDPDKKAAKMATNRRTLAVMARGLNAGGKLLWIAPGGGRDRPDGQDRYLPAQWDPSSVELMRKLVASAKKPGHLVPMAMFSYPIMPPPKKVEKDLGEERIIGFSGVGISVGPNFVPDTLPDDATAQQKEEYISKNGAGAQAKVTELYMELEKAILDKKYRESVAWASQPWKETASATA